MCIGANIYGVSDSLESQALFRCEKFLVKISHRMFRALSKGVFGY
jgi:hypothetical protein